MLFLIIENFLQYRDTVLCQNLIQQESQVFQNIIVYWDERHQVVVAPTPDATYTNSVKLYLERILDLSSTNTTTYISQKQNFPNGFLYACLS